MEVKSNDIKKYILSNNARQLKEMLTHGLDPNLEGGWPVRLAARNGLFSIVRIFILFGANPHLLSDSGASTLQLAVYSGKHWEGEEWTFLLSCCDSSQLADGAAVAIIFKNVAAYKKIRETGRCNTNIPTTLTGKTLEQLAKGYRLDSQLYLSEISATNRRISRTPNSSPRIHRNVMNSTSLTPQPNMIHENLSPSVSRFFHQTVSVPTMASLTALTSPSQINLN